MSSPRFQANAARPAAVAGTWYPGDAETLAAEVEALLQAATPGSPHGRLRAVVVPHAGLRWSGPTAACAYAALAEPGPRRVVVLAPNHRLAVAGAAVDPSSHYDTPLGRMAVDLDAVAHLAAQPLFTCTPGPFAAEHAIEMQLPFLQHCLPEATLVPVLVGEMRGSEAIETVATGLGPLLDDETLLVVSSDFMHYGDAFGYVPFTEHVAESIRDSDTQAIAALLRGSFDEFMAVLEQTGTTICGRRPLAVFLKLLPRAWGGELCDYTMSGAITGDWSHSVSYAALAYYEEPAPRLSADDERRLLRLARASIEQATGRRDTIDSETSAWSPALHAAAGAFVSLHRRSDGKLRGCIGWLEPHSSLGQAVIDNAAAAAQRDPRFPPVTADELEDLEIEISVLGPLEDLPDVAALRLGDDGLVVEHDGARGVLLPQVATHMGWNRVQFLAAVCRKAGLPDDRWQHGARLRRFAAVVFSDAGREP